MAKAKLTTRAISATTVTSDNLAKASQLTHNQLDSNFINLRDATFGVVADDSATIQVGMDSNLYIQGGSNVTTSTDSAGVVTINATGEVTASSTTTFTNKTFDADASGNALSNIEVDNLKSGVLDTDISSVAGTDTTLASAKAIKTYVDSQIPAAGQGFKVVGDDSAGVDIAEAGTLYIQGGTNISTSTDSSGAVTITGAGTATSIITDGLTIEDNDIKGTRTNENIVIRPSGTGSVSINKVAITSGTITGITDLVVADGGSGASSLTSNAVLTGNGTSPITAEGNLSFDGSTLAVTGAATVSTTLGVTGASTLDGVTVTDNTISTNASNANLEINANGSGTVNLENLKIGTSGATVTTILDEDAMGTDSATSLATQQSIKAYVDAQTHTGQVNEDSFKTISVSGQSDVVADTTTDTLTLVGAGGTTITTTAGTDTITFTSTDVGATLTGSTNNTLTTVTSANNIQGEANATFDGSTLAITGNITATTTIAATTAITAGTSITATTSIGNDAITIDDNVIKTTRSNDHFYINTSGSGDLILDAGDDVVIEATDDVKLKPGDDLFLVTNGSNNDIKFYTNNSSKLYWYGNYAAVWDIIKADDAVDQWNETGTNDYPDTGDDLWTVNVYGGTGSGAYDAGAGGKLLFEASADWSGSSRSTSFEIQLAQTGSTSLTTPFKIGATGDVVLTGGLTAGTSIENDAIRITDNTILGLRSNDNITITPAGTGSVVIEDVTFTDSTIGIGSSDRPLIMTAQGGDADTSGDGNVIQMLFKHINYHNTNVNHSVRKGGNLTLRGNLASGATADTGGFYPYISLKEYQTDGSIEIIPKPGQAVTIGAIKISGTTISSDDSTQVTIAEALQVNGAATLGTSVTLATGATVTGILDEDAMGTDSATQLATQQSIKAYVDGKTYVSLSGSTNNTIATVTGANAIQGETNATFDGSTLAITGAGTFSTTLGVTGASTLDGVTITDNTISSNASNADLEISANGTGNVSISSDGTFSSQASSVFTDNFGALARNKGVHIFRKETIGSALTSSSDRRQGHLIGQQYTLANYSSSDKDNRYRAQMVGCVVDLNGATVNSTNIYAGATGAQGQAAVSNTDASNAGTMGNSIGMVAGSYFYTPQTITVTNAHGVMGYVETDNNGGAITITNAYAYKGRINNYHGTITNGYGFYVDTNGATNKYGFYDNTASLSRFGAVILANVSDPSGVADSSHIYAKDVSTSSEVWVRDEAGNTTQLSPHNEQGEWQYYSKNTKTGKTVRVNMEKMIRKLEEFTGESFIETI